MSSFWKNKYATILAASTLALMALSGDVGTSIAATSDNHPPLYSSQGIVPINDPATIVLNDQKRGKQLSVTVLYPASGERYPVIIFSHGAGGSPQAYIKLLTFWAEHGYVVLAPTHADSEKSQSGLAGLAAALQSTDDPSSRINRVQDITLVINSLPSIARQLPGLQGKMNVTDLGVGGHSYGAYVSQIIGGAKVDLDNSGEQKSYRDNRVRSVLLMSPQGIGRMELTDTSWTDFTIPMLLMTGSLDKPFGNVEPSSRLDPYRLAPDGHKYEIYIDGANHLSFCDYMSSLPQRPRLFSSSQNSALTQSEIYDYVEAGSLAFWDATLKNSASAKRYLTSNDMLDTSNGAVHPSHG